MGKLEQGVNDLKTKFPDLAKEWDYDENGHLTPENVTFGSNEKVWWKCQLCGHKWQAKICNRTHGKGCPICANRRIAEKHHISAVKRNNLAMRFPELAAEWHPTKNGELKPENLSCSNDIIAWWKCSVCGNEFKMAIKHRTGRGDGCPACSKKGTSFPEQALFYYISKLCPDAKNRYSIDGVELDIYIPSRNCAIEYDGRTWHKNTTNRDNKKDELCFQKGIKLYRIRDESLPKTNHAECISCSETQSSIEKSIIQLITNLFGSCSIDVDLKRDELEIRTTLKRYFHDNSLAVKVPEIAKEFAEDLNNGLTAYNVSWSSGANVWWRCQVCGHVWKTTPNKRTRQGNGTGCPICAKSTASEKNKTKIINLDTLVVYDSVTEAAESCGCSKGEITSHCQGKRGLTRGYHWAYYDGGKPRHRDYSGPIINLDTQEVFNNPNDAAKSCNGDRRNIVQCCYGKTKTSYGYHWAFYSKD